MKRWGAPQLALALAGSAVAWIVIASACVAVGSTGSFSWPSDQTVFRHRLNLVLLASLVGAALAASGVAYQAVLRNPLADPYLLGVSSGASLATFLWALPFATAAPLIGSVSQQAFAFIGALASIGVVFLLAQRRGRLEPVTLLLVGVIVNAINGSVFLLIHHLNLRRDITNATGGPFRFLVGGLSSYAAREHVIAAAACIGAGWVLLMFLSGKLAVATLGEAEAEALGVRVNRLRWVALIVASLVTASAVAISGPIGFVGLICPHLARLIVGHDERRLLPVATGLGAGLLAIADALSRYLSRETLAQTLLPVGVLTGLVGGPFFLALLWRSTRRHSTPEAGP